MNRREFMGQLERLLADIPGQERQEALDYYNNYFDDAGEENEAEVIRTLGSPGKIAAVIKADLENTNSEAGSYTDAGYKDERFEEEGKVPETRRKYGYQAKKPRSAGAIILFIILAVFTLPFWGGIGAGILGILAGIIGIVIAVVVGSLAGGAGLSVAGVVVSVTGLVQMTGSIAVGLAIFGIGLLMTAVGLLLLMLFGWIISSAGPKLLRFIADKGNHILHRGKGEQE